MHVSHDQLLDWKNKLKVLSDQFGIEHEGGKAAVDIKTELLKIATEMEAALKSN